MIRKQPSPLLSTEASRWLARCPKKGNVTVSFGLPRGAMCIVPLGKAKTLRSMLAGLLGQDETPGQARAKKSRRGRAKR